MDDRLSRIGESRTATGFCRPSLLACVATGVAFLSPATRALDTPPLRTGVAEAGLRAWTFHREDRRGRDVPLTLVGISLSRMINDNVSAGVEIATFTDSPFSDSVVVDLRGRLFWWPMEAWTPWTELRVGGALGIPEGNATRIGGAFGIRWTPARWGHRWAFDLQLLGWERWRQDWAAEYVDEDQPSARFDWGLERFPGHDGAPGLDRPSSILSLPVLGISRLF
ncbi:MAG: hypothetical protein H6686_06185 [Fibrobacteria bacterium]|nr:hypothetical protein [Fibrobacteria bacterium]